MQSKIGKIYYKIGFLHQQSCDCKKQFSQADC